MFVPKLGLLWGPEFPDQPMCPVWRYVREYASCPDELHLTDMRASDCAFTIRDPHNVLCETEVGAWVNRWWHCGGYGISLLLCVGSEVDCGSIRCYEEV